MLVLLNMSSLRNCEEAYNSNFKILQKWKNVAGLLKDFKENYKLFVFTDT